MSKAKKTKVKRDRTLRSFFFHFNKPATLAAKEVRISVHHAGICHIVNNIVCLTPTVGKIRKRQPRFIMTGKCRNISISNNTATIS